MCDDVDFLSECDTLVLALKVQKHKMISNPLMLPNTLQEETADTEALDATVTDSKKKKERQVLRAAEKILRLEQKFKDAVEAVADTNFTSNNNNNNGEDDGSYNSMGSEQSEDYESELMSWYDKAQAQLLALSQPISGYTKHKSRNLGGEKSASMRNEATTIIELSILTRRFTRPSQISGTTESRVFPVRLTFSASRRTTTPNRAA